MGHKNKKSLILQVTENLTGKMADGVSKHYCKEQGIDTTEVIFSYSTLRNYIKHDCYFVKYCKKEHRCRTLEDCRPYVNEWLQSRFDLSAYTVKLESSALAKLYGCHTTDFIKTPARHREDIKRSRETAERDSHFSEEKNKDLVDFCKSTGLRRRELSQLRGDCLVYINGQPHIHVCRGGKGGRERYAPVIGNVGNVERLMQTAGTGRVFKNVPSCADIHGYRRFYATEMYKLCERTYRICSQAMFYNPERQKMERSLYICRGDRKGTWFDKQAMLTVSRALGHNRISVVGEHYIDK